MHKGRDLDSLLMDAPAPYWYISARTRLPMPSSGSFRILHLEVALTQAQPGLWWHFQPRMGCSAPGLFPNDSDPRRSAGAGYFKITNCIVAWGDAAESDDLNWQVFPGFTSFSIASWPAEAKI